MKKYIITTTLAFLFTIGLSLLFAFFGKSYLAGSKWLTVCEIALGVLASLILLSVLIWKIVALIKQRNDRYFNVIKYDELLRRRSNLAKRDIEKFTKNVLFSYNLFIAVLFLTEFIISTAFILGSLLIFIKPLSIAVVVFTADVIISSVKFFLMQDGEFGLFGIEFDENEYPELYKIIKGVYKAFGFKKISTYISFDANVTFTRAEGDYSLYIGLTTYQLLSDDELKSVIYREIAFKTSKTYKKLARTNHLIEKYKYIYAKTPFSGKAFGYLFLCDSALMRDRAFIERELSSQVDKMMAETPYARLYASAYKKIGMFGCFVSDERCNVNKELFSTDLNASSYGDFILNEFFSYYEIYGGEWEREVMRTLSPEVPRDGNYHEKMNALKIDSDSVDAVFEKRCDDEYNSLVSRANAIYYEGIKDEYKAKKENYQFILAQISRYENNKEAFTERRALLNVANCYKIVGNFEEAVKIYKQLSENDKVQSELFCEEGNTLLSL